jgi:hypothetical protein
LGRTTTIPPKFLNLLFGQRGHHFAAHNSIVSWLRLTSRDAI